MLARWWQSLRDVSQTTVAALGRELELTRTRVATGKFVMYTVCVMSGYGFALRGLIEWTQGDSGSTLRTLPVILAFSGTLFLMMVASGYPLRVYGLTTVGWREHIGQALVWSLPVMLLSVIAKWVLIETVPRLAGVPLFDFAAVVRGSGSGDALLAGGVYLLVVPFQEIAARGALQSSLHMFLTGRWKTLQAIVISNVMFASGHLHLSILFAGMAFVSGLFWGALFARQRSLVGVCVSHLLIGSWVFSVLGVEALIYA